MDLSRFPELFSKPYEEIIIGCHMMPTILQWFTTFWETVLKILEHFIINLFSPASGDRQLPAVARSVASGPSPRGRRPMPDQKNVKHVTYTYLYIMDHYGS
jgi:hypothetical protein